MTKIKSVSILTGLIIFERVPFLFCKAKETLTALYLFLSVLTET
ncbi:hypothetical protein [Lactococcus protaetiae]|nr:hypothetical protein [Lactococcus protaetiae]